MSGKLTSRERIFERIGRALGGERPVAVALPPLRQAGIFEAITDPLARFEAECEANRTEVVRVTGAQAAERLEEVLAGGGGENRDGGVLFQDAPGLRQLAAGLGLAWQRRLHWASDGRTLGSDAAGVTLAEALVARTGSILVSATCGGRTASVLPPLHIVYAHVSQIIAETEDALARLQVDGPTPATSLYSLITGPSRTSDIEKMLVMGAHGPRRLVVLLQTDG